MFLFKKFVKLFKSDITIHKDWAADLYCKKLGLLKQIGSIDTLVLGSSHGDYGFDPSYYQTNAFNLASASQDLYYSYSLLHKIIDKPNNIKNIILFFSVFSNGFELIKTSEYHRCILYKGFFDIPYQYKERDLAKKEKAYKKFYKQLRKKVQADEDYLGYKNQTVFFGNAFTAEQRAKTHLRENTRVNEQPTFILEIAKTAKENNKELYVLLAPARSDYKSNLPPSAELFLKLYSCKEESGFNIINLYDDNYFDNDDFGDYDHLNSNGAIKLTQKLNEIIKR